jgi:hypothetical protein
MFLSGKKVSYIGGTLSQRMTGSSTTTRRKAMLKAAFKFGAKMQDGCKTWK